MEGGNAPTATEHLNDSKETVGTTHGLGDGVEPDAISFRIDKIRNESDLVRKLGSGKFHSAAGPGCEIEGAVEPIRGIEINDDSARTRLRCRSFIEAAADSGALVGEDGDPPRTKRVSVKRRLKNGFVESDCAIKIGDGYLKSRNGRANRDGGIC